jgi:hypothetical protein
VTSKHQIETENKISEHIFKWKCKSHEGETKWLHHSTKSSSHGMFKSMKVLI